MPRKEFKLITVRHGQAEHNLANGDKSRIQFTQEQNPQVDSELTELGRQQASQVAARLSSTKIHLAISSDLKRAVDTAKAIAKPPLDVTRWRIVRERSLGDFEGIKESEKIVRAQLTVEGAVEDRNLLTFRPPNGESVVDLMNRIKTFLLFLQDKVVQLPQENPTVLLVSHGLFLKELYHVLSLQKFSENIPRKHQDEVQYQNTGLAQYTFVISSLEDGTCVMEKATCDILSCAVHLNVQL